MIQYSNMIVGTEIIFLIIIGVIIAVVISVVRKRKNSNVIVKDDSKEDDVSTIKQEQNVNSLKILRERLAKGEITKEEYDNLKQEFENQ